MVVSGSWSISGLHRETTVLSLVMAYRSFGRFRRASTRLDTPPCSGRHHPVSAIALLSNHSCIIIHALNRMLELNARPTSPAVREQQVDPPPLKWPALK